MTARYNEIDANAVAVLREFVACGLIAPGDVDGRSIKEVTANDIRGYTQCHFFAGAGLWSVAARIAGWSDRRPLWTASCPCQPFSGAGKQGGTDDPRHLWPDLYRIIRTARDAGQPIPIIVGEQVAGSLGYDWFDGVRSDLAREKIAARTIDIPACAVDAPHERNRLWWCAVADTQEQRGGAGLCKDRSIGHRAFFADRNGGDIVLADAQSLSRGREQPQRGSQGRTPDGFADAVGSLADADILELQRQPSAGQQRIHEQDAGPRPGHNSFGRNGSFWADAEWIACHDGKARRAKPEISMLVDGMVGRIDLWRLAGNSIVPWLAAEVLASILDAEADLASALPSHQSPTEAR
jgi:DNA (cytosine-5)-methyltransferase 1